ncbi:MAG TPA: DinB family protein [Acidimicrobiales bacterium]|nr:DinB family protein [Acidimicrobiales bacterium]
MYAPEPHSEIEGILGYVEQQLDAIRAAAIGLTEEQARQRPCRSALTIGGLVKHVTSCMRGATERVTGASAPMVEIDEDAYAAHEASFSLTDDETAAGALADFDAARAAYVAALAAADPDEPTVEDPAPWFGIDDNRPARLRYILLHQIEEYARHAGHADIIREQLDGVSVSQIMLTRDGMPSGDFFEPYVPAAGTIGAT